MLNSEFLVLGSCYIVYGRISSESYEQPPHITFQAMNIYCQSYVHLRDIFSHFKPLFRHLFSRTYYICVVLDNIQKIENFYQLEMLLINSI